MNIATKKEQLYAELKVGILEGKYCGKFPPEPVFARQLKVSRNTLRSVYKLLENDGLLVRHPGNGTSLTPGGRRMPQKILFTYMVPNKHFTVDFIIPSILQGVEKALPPEWGLESCPISQLRELPLEKAVQIIKARNICALLIADSCFMGDEAILQLVRQSQLPAVLCYCNPDDSQNALLPAVAKCSRQAWQAGLGFLAQNGHTRVVTLNDTAAKIRGSYSLEEYLELQKKIGLEPAPELVLNLELDEDKICEALKKLDRNYTAVYCYSDFYAQALYRALYKLGLRVPEDVSVLGYCGFCGGAYFDPPLTTVELDYSGIGIQAVEMLKRSQEWFNKGAAALPFSYTTYRIRQRESLLPLK